MIRRRLGGLVSYTIVGNGSYRSWTLCRSTWTAVTAPERQLPLLNGICRSRTACAMVCQWSRRHMSQANERSRRYWRSVSPKLNLSHTLFPHFVTVLAHPLSRFIHLCKFLFPFLLPGSFLSSLPTLLSHTLKTSTTNNNRLVNRYYTWSSFPFLALSHQNSDCLYFVCMLLSFIAQVLLCNFIDTLQSVKSSF